MSENRIDIDGSRGEGGGQILRSSLALSLVTGRSVRLSRIRAGRQRPGLQPQHLICVEAAARVGNAQVIGGSIGSQELEFRPAAVVGGVFAFDIRTAGSATLVLQTVLPALMLASDNSRVSVTGGTHNPFAPPVDFLEHVYLPQLKRMGPSVGLHLERHGFFPAGGGKVVAEITPSNKLQGFDLLERGALGEHSVRALVARLPLDIARREVNTVLDELGWSLNSGRAEEVGSNGPGNVVMATVESANCCELISEFGKRGVPAEQVAKRVARGVQAYLSHDAPVGEHLADQWMLPLGLAVWQNGLSHQFRSGPLSLHATTHLEILEMFLGVKVLVDTEEERGTVRVSLLPS
jgi:RNA 3'-terminal phosphate cyclase (ATP)